MEAHIYQACSTKKPSHCWEESADLQKPDSGKLRELLG
jgi:hypothetical protein